MKKVHYLDMENNFFHDQFSEETFYGFFRQHWFFLLPSVARIIGSTIFVILILWLSQKYLADFSIETYHFVILLLFLAFLVEINIFFCSLASWLLTIVILTDHRVIEVIKSLFIHDEKEVVDLKKVQDIQMRKIGLIRNFLDMGRIHLTLSNIGDSKTIRHVPHVSFWTQKFNKVKLKALTKKNISNGHIHNIIKKTEKNISEISDLDV